MVVSAMVLAIMLLYVAFLSFRPGLLPTQPGELRRVYIVNDWWGWGPNRQIRFTLAPEGGDFAGEAFFAEVRDATVIWSSTHELRLPAGVMENFLFVLSQAPLVEGEYDPGIDLSGDYPSRRIELETARGKVVIHSEAQGEGGAPWAAEIGGRGYVIHADVPMRALNVLAPHLVRPASE
ncbi:hypothetical protein HS125_11130 [bacterium]|nr:hypothetical protein [bacterium]